MIGLSLLIVAHHTMVCYNDRINQRERATVSLSITVLMAIAREVAKQNIACARGEIEDGETVDVATYGICTENVHNFLLQTDLERIMMILPDMQEQLSELTEEQLG
jgi:hypothetical protein